MSLLVPKPNEVEEFHRICRERLGLELTATEASDLASRVLRIAYFRYFPVSRDDPGRIPELMAEEERLRDRRSDPSGQQQEPGTPARNPPVQS